MKDLRPRIIGAIIYCSLLLIATFQGGLLQYVIYLMFAGLLHYELQHLLKTKHQIHYFSLAIFASSIFLYNYIGERSQGFILTGALATLFTYYFLRAIHSKIAKSYNTLAVIYVTFPLFFILVYSGNFADYNWRIIGILLYLVWMNDTAAYLIGSTIGKKPLSLKFSPNKTWEGTLGGLIMTLALLPLFLNIIEISWDWWWLAIGAMTVMAGTIGDLFESILKRNSNKKDSGQIIPGHGGFLDRMDSFLFSIPFYLFLLYLFIF